MSQRKSFLVRGQELLALAQAAKAKENADAQARYDLAVAISESLVDFGSKTNRAIRPIVQQPSTVVVHGLQQSGFSIAVLGEDRFSVSSAHREIDGSLTYEAMQDLVLRHFFNIPA